MNILVIGQGGREHALLMQLHQEQKHQLHALPGSDGISEVAKCHQGSITDFDFIASLCLANKIDLVIVGPEDPLVSGIGDFLRSNNILVFGPNKSAALLEGSKIFAKQFMFSGNVPTAKAEVVSSWADIELHTHQFKPPYVLKADGLAAGKGVFICKSIEELKDASKKLFEDRIFGAAGTRALLEENLQGWELSYLVLTNGNEFEVLPLAQDHKRLHDFHQGPNTGGMGTVAPLQIDERIRLQIDNQIVTRTLNELRKQNLFYRGVLFIGIMITPDGPKVIEYNVRFGDPETQVILPLISNPLSDVLFEVARGRVPKLSYNNLNACCVVLAAPGYPDKPILDRPILGKFEGQTHSQYFVHSGSYKKNEKWFSKGGRILGAVGVASQPNEAIRKAYELMACVSSDGSHYRNDIGAYLNNFKTADIT